MIQIKRPDRWLKGIGLYLAIVLIGYGLSWRDFTKKLIPASSQNILSNSANISKLRTEGLGSGKSYIFNLSNGGATFELLPGVYDRSDLDDYLTEGAPVSIAYNNLPPFYVVGLTASLPTQTVLVATEQGHKNLQKLAESGFSRALRYILAGLVFGIVPWIPTRFYKHLRRR